MKTIQKCDQSVFQGALVQWSGDVLSLLTDGPCAGVAGLPFEASLAQSIDDPGQTILVTELTIHGEAKAKLSGSMSKQGGNLYRAESTLSATENGQVLAKAIPADLNSQHDFSDGDLIDVILL
jgi:hypothetical protein